METTETVDTAEMTPGSAIRCRNCPFYDPKAQGIRLHHDEETGTTMMTFATGACRGAPMSSAAALGHVDPDVDWCAKHPMALAIAGRQGLMDAQQVVLATVDQILESLKGHFPNGFGG